MWQMYGDAARGVCLVMDWEKAQDLALYKVCYLNKTQKGYSVRVGENQSIDTNRVERHLRSLRHTGHKLRNLDEKLVFDAMIAPILYLFKDISYSYEQEYRIMYQFEKYDERIRHTKPKELLKGTETKALVPMLYVLPDHPIQIKELILGPKFEDITNTLPYLHEQLEKMAERTGTKEPRITISNINFK